MVVELLMTWLRVRKDWAPTLHTIPHNWGRGHPPAGMRVRTATKSTRLTSCKFHNIHENECLFPSSSNRSLRTESHWPGSVTCSSLDQSLWPSGRVLIGHVKVTCPPFLESVDWLCGRKIGAGGGAVVTQKGGWMSEGLEQWLYICLLKKNKKKRQRQILNMKVTHDP